MLMSAVNQRLSQRMEELCSLLKKNEEINKKQAEDIKQLRKESVELRKESVELRIENIELLKTIYPLKNEIENQALLVQSLKFAAWQQGGTGSSPSSPSSSQSSPSSAGATVNSTARHRRNLLDDSNNSSVASSGVLSSSAVGTEAAQATMNSCHTRTGNVLPSTFSTAKGILAVSAAAATLHDPSVPKGDSDSDAERTGGASFPHRPKKVQELVNFFQKTPPTE